MESIIILEDVEPHIGISPSFKTVIHLLGHEIDQAIIDSQEPKSELGTLPYEPLSNIYHHRSYKIDWHTV